MKGTHERNTDANGMGQAAYQQKMAFPANLPDPAQGPDPSSPGPVRIPPAAFIRAMIAVAWSAFRHPFSTTVIDLSTGKVVREV